MTNASDRQVSYATSLAGDRDTSALDARNAATLTAILAGAATDKRAASALIDALLRAPRVARAVADAAPCDERFDYATLAVGVYVMPDGTIVKVNAPRNARNANARYAKVWGEINAERALENGERARGDWSYAPGLIAHVRADYAMTQEQAAAFGVRYGVCVRCGRALRAAESVERAIGPVCWKAFRAA